MKKRTALIPTGFVLLMVLSLPVGCQRQNESAGTRELAMDYHGDAQIEVGGPFVGIEMHHGSPMPSRISFFYPVANSIDLSTGYWQRDQFRAMFMGLKMGEGEKEWIGPESYEYELTPFKVMFHQADSARTINISYRFCKDSPAMVATIELVNNAATRQDLEVYTHLEASIRTSHTYKMKNVAWTEFDETGSSIYVNYNDEETARVQLFIANAAELPVSYATDGELIGQPSKDRTWWMNRDSELPASTINENNPRRPVAAYVYKKSLASQEKMTIVQIIGSCKKGEGREIVNKLLQNHSLETKGYEDSVLARVPRSGIETGDPLLDHSAKWASAILAANAHYLDGEIVPMPCPAEYNFYFTHDVLVTDLAAVNFDVDRVKKDLRYIIAHAGRDGVIPHAYYWKDDRFVTEFAGPDNWNHFWFVLVSGSYLRRSNDIDTATMLYPLLRKSIEVIKLKIKNDLMWADHPDWWDIGKNPGPRSYMTILAIRALREFLYVSVRLEHNSELMEYEELSIRMTEKLNEKMWDDEMDYFVNYNEDGSRDSHFYIGSLLAAHFRLAKPDKIAKSIQSARKNLLDEKLGIYNAYPMDFHLLKDFYKFHENEQGDQFYYFNGGIWSHGNAWFALALIAGGQMQEASRFVKNIMSVTAVSSSPNGQPAMYEYRNANHHAPDLYGRIDKPQFLWAAGWYLYVLYQLSGLRDNAWNIAFEPYLPEGQPLSRFNVMWEGKELKATVTGAGNWIKQIRFNGMSYASAVVPVELRPGNAIEIELGKPMIPYVASTNSILLSGEFDRKNRTSRLNLKAFRGHRSKTMIISQLQPKSVWLNGRILQNGWEAIEESGIYHLDLNTVHENAKDLIEIRYNQ